MLVPGRKEALRPSLEYPVRSLPTSQSLQDSVALMIPVCETHRYSSQGDCRLRLFCTVSVILTLAIGVFSGLAIGDSLWRAQPIPPWTIGALLLFVAAVVLTCAAFRRNPAESAVRIVGFDAGLQHVFLHFKNVRYRDEFLRENQMTAELVTWVRRARV